MTLSKNDVKNILATILATYQNFRIADKSEDVWFVVLAHLDRADVFKGLAIYLSQAHDFAPTPGHINQIVREMKRTEDNLITAGEAWDMAVGFSCSPNPQNALPPRVYAAMRQTGVERIRYTDFEDIGFVMRDFARNFEEAKERDALVEINQLPQVTKDLIGMATKKIPEPKKQLEVKK